MTGPDVSDRAFRVLGVDTSLRCTGTGVVEARGNRMAALAFGRICGPAREPKSCCLARLGEAMTALICAHKPDCAAIEGVFFAHNMRTAVTLGEARGVVIAACAAARIPVFEYAPRRVKQAVVGYGGAPKEQVQRMVASILGVQAPLSDDESDALALAICHLNSRAGHAALSPEPI